MGRDASILNQLQVQNDIFKQFRTHRPFRNCIFNVTAFLATLFRRFRLFIPTFLVIRMYVFVKRFYRDLALYYYFRDRDDVGLFECFVLNAQELDQVEELTLRQERILKREQYYHDMHDGKNDEAAQENLDINMRVTTTHKKKVIAEKTVRTNTVLLYFSKRIEKINPKLYHKVETLYRTLRCSVFLRKPRFFENEDKHIRKANVDALARLSMRGEF